MSAAFQESPRMIAHRRYLASVNPDIEAPRIIPMEAEYTVPAAGIGNNGAFVNAIYNVPSNKDCFITGIIGACEIIPSQAPGTVLDPDIQLPDLIRLQVKTVSGKDELFVEGTPTGQRAAGLGKITLSHLVATPFRPKAQQKLSGIWRVSAEDTIEVEYQVLPAWPLAVGQTRRFGISLVAILIRQAELIAYGRI